jgi:hypothetical protein
MIALPEEVNVTLHNVHIISPRKTQSPVLSARSQTPPKKMLSNPSTDSMAMKRLPIQESVGTLKNMQA